MRPPRNHATGRLAAALVFAAMLGGLTSAPAGATFTIVNMDDPNEGFNDPTPAAPVGGNPGTTVGQQRLNVFKRAGAIWDVILNSSVEIRVQASFDPLPATRRRPCWAPLAPMPWTPTSPARRSR
jgi:hypothetical protein